MSCSESSRPVKSAMAPAADVELSGDRTVPPLLDPVMPTYLVTYRFGHSENFGLRLDDFMIASSDGRLVGRDHLLDPRPLRRDNRRLLPAHPVAGRLRRTGRHGRGLRPRQPSRPRQGTLPRHQPVHRRALGAAAVKSLLRPVLLESGERLRRKPHSGGAPAIRHRACRRRVSRAASLPISTPVSAAASRYQLARQLRQKPARFIRSMFWTSLRVLRCSTRRRNTAASNSVRVACLP